jgi:hypothetical protein
VRISRRDITKVPKVRPARPLEEILVQTNLPTDAPTAVTMNIPYA